MSFAHKLNLSQGYWRDPADIPALWYNLFWIWITPNLLIFLKGYDPVMIEWFLSGLKRFEFE
jgi:hypothetical protein